MDTPTFLSVVSFTGMVIMTVAYFRTQWKKGGSEATKDLNQTTQEVITTYKTQVEQYKEQIANYRKDMHDLTLKIGNLEGALQEKDKQNKEFRDILLGRNPDMDMFYKKALPLFERLSVFLEKNNQ